MIDYNQKIAELRAQKSELMAQSEQLVTDGKLDELDTITDKMNGINANIDRMVNLAAASNQRADEAYDGVLHNEGGKAKTEDKDDVHFFNSLGEQLQAIANAKKTGTVDERLMKVQNAAKGANEGTGADGGFLLQPDFAGKIMESAVQSSPLLNRLDRHTCSAASNSMRWIQADETDVSTSVFGGVQMYWAAEAATVNASKPQFKENKLDLEKMMGFAYITDEMLQDAAFLSGFLGGAFTLAGDRLLTDSVINGDGNGKPLGLLHATSLVEIAKESGQKAGSLLGANVLKMQTRTLPRSRSNLVWLMHPDLEEELPTLQVGEGAAARLLWNPEGGLGGYDTQRVLNKPVLFEDSCAAQGEKGDTLLVDPSAYILLSKGTARQDWSIHVEFLSDQSCFRVIFRCNGKPKLDTLVKLKNSTKQRSAFVTLAARA